MKLKASPPPVQAPLPPPAITTEDDVIRSHGFRIHSRPATGPVLWELDGKTYTHAFALEIAARRFKLRAQMDQAMQGDEAAAPMAAAKDDRVTF